MCHLTPLTAPGLTHFFCTMQSGPQGSDMGNFSQSFSTWEHKNEQEFSLKTLPPHSLPPSTPPALIPLWLIDSWAPCSRAFYEKTPFVRKRHLLDPKYKTLHFPPCLPLCLTGFSNHSLPLSCPPLPLSSDASLRAIEQRFSACAGFMIFLEFL